MNRDKRIPQDSVGFDSGSMRYLSADSMAALFGKKVMQYHRKKNALELIKRHKKPKNTTLLCLITRNNDLRH